jgi:hypothetical protein
MAHGGAQAPAAAPPITRGQMEHPPGTGSGRHAKKKKKGRNLLEIEPHVIRYSQNGVIYPRNSLRQSARFQNFPPFPLIQFENHRQKSVI